MKTRNEQVHGGTRRTCVEERAAYAHSGSPVQAIYGPAKEAE
ncbi:MAG: hypothetical protein ACRDGH_05825 [Candidatus Limnocylindria bacterium]